MYRLKVTSTEKQFIREWVKALGAYDMYINQHLTYMVVQVPALRKKICYIFKRLSVFLIRIATVDMVYRMLELVVPCDSQLWN